MRTVIQGPVPTLLTCCVRNQSPFVLSVFADYCRLRLKDRSRGHEAPTSGRILDLNSWLTLKRFQPEELAEVYGSEIRDSKGANGTHIFQSSGQNSSSCMWSSQLPQLGKP